MIQELAIKIRFDSIKGLAGDSYCEKRMDIIQSTNPFNYKGEKQQNSDKSKATLSLLQGLGLFSSSDKK